MIYEVLGFHPDKKYAQIFIEVKDQNGVISYLTFDHKKFKGIKLEGEIVTKKVRKWLVR